MLMNDIFVDFAVGVVSVVCGIMLCGFILMLCDKIDSWGVKNAKWK